MECLWIYFCRFSCQRCEILVAVNKVFSFSGIRRDSIIIACVYCAYCKSINSSLGGHFVSNYALDIIAGVVSKHIAVIKIHESNTSSTVQQTLCGYKSLFPDVLRYLVLTLHT